MTPRPSSHVILPGDLKHRAGPGTNLQSGMESGIRPIVKIARGRAVSDGAGVKLIRSIGIPTLLDVDPFLMLDEFRSDQADDYVAGFPNHPHRGFETVTYMLAGRMRHSDNQGNSGLLGPGSVQWMTAGRGIIHSEMPEQEDGLLWGFQLWVNLPAKDKMVAPRYQDIPADQVPVVTTKDATIKIIAGQYQGQTGPVQAVVTDPIYLDVDLRPNAEFRYDLPVGHTAFIYVFDGEVETAGDDIQRGEVAVFGKGDFVHVSSKETQSRFLFIAGVPIHEPIVRHGPFVMNTPTEIRQAVDDYSAGRF